MVTILADIGEYRALRDHWGGAYAISRVPGAARPYRAARRDNGAELAAATVDVLRGLIRADYLARPVPREVAP